MTNDLLVGGDHPLQPPLQMSQERCIERENAHVVNVFDCDSSEFCVKTRSRLSHETCNQLFPSTRRCA
jgi:hypothetical protein